MDAVILAGGDFPRHEVPLAILHSAPLVVACDGAISRYPQADVVVGDGDSVPPEFRDRLVRIDEQDDNDLTKATRYCISHLSPLTSHLSSLTSHLSPLTSHLSPLTSQFSVPRIAYLGCTGRREDHTLGNIALLMRYYREMGVEGRMLTDYGIFTPARGECTFQSYAGQQVSIFNFGSRHITSEGLKWSSYAYEQLWQGTLNEALADHFTLSADGYYMVYQTY